MLLVKTLTFLSLIIYQDYTEEAMENRIAKNIVFYVNVIILLGVCKSSQFPVTFLKTRLNTQ